jgi:hypothetical protein
LHRLTLYALSVALVLVLGGLSTGVIDSGHMPASEDASSTVAPGEGTPYVSELAPPVSRAPVEAGLPPTGQRETSSFPWPAVAGIAASVLGVLLIHAGVSSLGASRTGERATA